jgi:hypothetical protein
MHGAVNPIKIPTSAFKFSVMSARRDFPRQDGDAAPLVLADAVVGALLI